MGLSTLFGRNELTRERPPNGLKHVRHAGRAQRLSFGRQLRTFMCFTTEEKLAQGSGSGGKRGRRKSGSLSQRLRLSESCEDQSSSSPLETLSGLVLRPSTCPPETELEPPPTPRDPSDRPSSFTLSSLNEQQLDAYLKIMFKRCTKEKSRPPAQKTGQDVGDVVVGSGERLEDATTPVTTAEALNSIASTGSVGDARFRRPTRRECEELIHHHERLFGPIVTSRPAPLSHWLPQPAAALPEPCLPSEADATYLSIPQHGEAATHGLEWDSWRGYFSSGPDGVWRIVTNDPPAAEVDSEQAEIEAAALANARPRRLFGTLRDKCSALFCHEQKTRPSETTAIDAAALESEPTGAENEDFTEEIKERVLSEAKSEDMLKDMNEDEVKPCVPGPHPSSVPDQTKHDPQVYRDGAFRHWSRFFRWSGARRSAPEASSVDESRMAIAAAPELPISCVHQSLDLVGATDWLPASLWWGVSPLLEVVLRVAEAGRLAALLALLRPASLRLRHGGLARLVERLSEPPPPADRSAVWLSRPELPQLFTAAGLGPEDMTRWVLRVPHEPEDDAVPLAAAAAATETPAQQSKADAETPCEPPDRQLTPSTTPRAKFFEELMRTPESECVMELPVDRSDELQSLPQDNTDGHILIQQTDTSRIATPATRFSANWGEESRSDQVADGHSQSQEISTALLSPSAAVAMPLCSDVCTFLLPEHQDNSSVENNVCKAADSRQAYETYGTEQWDQLATRPRPKAERSGRRQKPVTADTAAASSVLDKSSDADPVGSFDSETELGAHLPDHPSKSTPAPVTDCYDSQLRNSSLRPIDSEVDIAQVLHEQSGYATLGDTTVAAPARGGYQALALHEVDSETELGLALPITEEGQPLSEVEHRRVTAYDSETEVAALITSLSGTDSETEMGERLRRLTGRRAGEERSPELMLEKRSATAPDSVTRLPAAPVPVDSETEMGVVLRLFQQGLLPSRYFARVTLPDEPDASDSDIIVCQSQSQGVRFSASPQDQMSESARDKAPVGCENLPLPIDDIYHVSKEVSKKVISKALFLLGSDPPTRPLTRTGSSPFGPGSGLDSIELEREAAADSAAPQADGVCDPHRVIPEVNLTTSDGSLVVLFQSRPADAAPADTGYYETDEGLMLRLEKRQQRPVAESGGFQPAEAGLSLSEQELSSTRRLLDKRCADAALRRRSPSPRTRASDDGSLRVLYRAESAEPWQPVSPEGLSGLALAPTDPELAALRWRKSSRGEDGDPEAWSAGEAASPPATESQSQTELRKEKPMSPAAGGANSWC